MLIYHVQAEMNIGGVNVRLYIEFEYMTPVTIGNVENN